MLAHIHVINFYRVYTKAIANYMKYLGLVSVMASTSRTDKSHCPTPRASASPGRASGFLVHKLITDKLKSMSDKSFEK